MKTKQKFQPVTLTLTSKKQLKALYYLIGGLTWNNENALGMQGKNPEDTLDDLYYQLQHIIDCKGYKTNELCVNISVG